MKKKLVLIINKVEKTLKRTTDEKQLKTPPNVFFYVKNKEKERLFFTIEIFSAASAVWTLSTMGTDSYLL